ncbi:MAG: hypothetical protein WCX28_08235 [Bacteriovoracaceae bacterium]|nr:hypothetical protein [Bacteroidota bacterium]
MIWTIVGIAYLVILGLLISLGRFLKECDTAMMEFRSKIDIDHPGMNL